jgi:hypothetical protein
MYVRLDAPARVSLFVYDNDRFIVESFQDAPVDAHIVTDKRITKLRDVVCEAREGIVPGVRGSAGLKSRAG